MTPVTVLPTKFIRAWPRHEIGGAVEVVDLIDALENTYPTDAHFAMYASPNGRRLSREALDREVAVEIHCIVFDVDCEATHGTPEPAPREWRKAQRDLVVRLAADHPDPYMYETRGGYRIVYRQGEPTVLRSQADAQRWAQDYSLAVAHLRRVYGIQCDPACQDWQRVFRLPHATRDGSGHPENYPAWGMPDWPIGELLIKATAEDMREARALTKAFGERRIESFTPCTSDGLGLLYHALRARGDVIREHIDGAFVVRCPRERDHTAGRTGDGSTVLYPPAPGRELGAIHCMHAHCSGLGARDWLACFTDSELDAARGAAGIATRRPRCS